MSSRLVYVNTEAIQYPELICYSGSFYIGDDWNQMIVDIDVRFIRSEIRFLRSMTFKKDGIFTDFFRVSVRENWWLIFVESSTHIVDCIHYRN